MLKRFSSLMLAVFLSAGAFAASTPSVDEPDFVGESVYVAPDGSVLSLEKNRVQVEANYTARSLVGFGKVRSKIVVEHPMSTARIRQHSGLQFVVRAVDNLSDPMSIISVMHFDSGKKDRKIEVARSGMFTSHANTTDYVDFSAKKYGESSYLVTIGSIAPGEYGITVKNPNIVDEKTIIVSCFGVD